MKHYRRSAAIIALSCAACHGAWAGGQPEPASNPGDLPYRPIARVFGRLVTLLPAARGVDPVLQMSFKALTPPEQDAFLKPTWNVAIVSGHAELDLPVLRGGYFQLPADAAAGAIADDARLRFNSPTRKNIVHVVWKLRLRDPTRLAYADFARALQDVQAVQSAIPWYSIELRAEKRERFNALKACFSDADGAILVDGKAVAAIASANCRIYPFDAALAASGAQIEFAGAPQIVVLDNTARYQPAGAVTPPDRPFPDGLTTIR